MIKSNAVMKNESIEWSLDIWNYLVYEISNVFNLSIMEIENLKSSNTAKIIATIPFVAQCVEPERTAIAHLCLYIAEKKGFQKYCAHVPSDDKDIFKRLDFISTFEGGNQLIIEHGMSILALIMLEGYKKSAKKDTINNIYNPIVKGTWNYQNLKNQLLQKISKISVPELDVLIHVLEGQW